MACIVQLGSSLGLCPTFSSPNSRYNSTFKLFDLVSSLVLWESVTNIHIPAETAHERGRLSVPPLIIAYRPRPYLQQLLETHSSKPTQQVMSWLQPADDARTNQSRGPSTTNQTNHSCFSYSNSSSKSKPQKVFWAHIWSSPYTFPAPTSPAAVPAPSSSSISCTDKQPTLADRLQLHPTADFYITIVCEQQLLGLTQHIEDTSTRPRLIKILHNRVSDHAASATSNWILWSATGQSLTPTQTTSWSLSGPIFNVIDSPNKSWPFELTLLSLSF